MPKVPLFDPPCMQLAFDPVGDERRPWITLRPHEFRNGVFTLIVAQGLRSDLASVPNGLLWLCDPIGKHQRAALFHDAAYRTHPCSRFTADAMFRAIMEHDGVSWWRAMLMYYAVRLFGSKAWKANEGVSDP